jgi:hypothetical protein
MRSQRFAILLSLFVLLSFSIVQAQEDAPAGQPYGTAVLEGFAVMPADTFADGPASGAAIDPAGNNNGRTVPFESQPVQGFSTVIAGDNGNWLALSDNGYGGKGNSADYLLRWHEVAVDFEAGTVEPVGFTQLADPDHLIPFPIVNEDTEERFLTGADFDVESFRRLPDGTFFVGEEFGPYLLHFSADGVLLNEPIATPYPTEYEAFTKGLEFIQSPQNPAFVDLADDAARIEAANLPGSKGFEGMALNTSGTLLYPMLEGAIVGDEVPTRLLIQEFDPATLEYTGNYYFYNMNTASNAIGELTAINDTQFIVIERDNGQGNDAAFKRIYLIDTANVGEDGHTLTKTLVADLLAIYDVNGLTTAEDGVVGFGPVFKFPFQTIESVWPVDADTLLIVDDNNYPFSSGRRPGLEADDTEFIQIGLPVALDLATAE